MSTGDPSPADTAKPEGEGESPPSAPPPPFDSSRLIPTVHETKAMPDRETTNAALDTVLATQRAAPSDVYGSGPLLLSDIPDNIREKGGDQGVVLGIDEAGRGPVLGPMTYGCAFWHPSSSDIPSDFNDSKQLSAEKRASLFQTIRTSKNIGFVLRVLHASEISRNMLRRSPYNLNAMSHDAAMEMIRAVLNAGVRIDTAYVDTVGIPEAYQRKLERAFEGHNINFVVEKKADAKYAPCSAASVVAKEARDRMTSGWKFTEAAFGYKPQGGFEVGSGYPSDPKCKAWMGRNCNVDSPFGFPDFVRFSWGPAKNALKEVDEGKPGTRGLGVRWEADDDDEDEKQSSLDSFVTVRGGNKRRKGCLDGLRKRSRPGVFNDLGLTKLTKPLVESAY